MGEIAFWGVCGHSALARRSEIPCIFVQKMDLPMRIISWNVNGLRSALNKGAGLWIQHQNPDVVCLQEIKVNQGQLGPDQLDTFQGYQQIWHAAQRPGYSGVLTLTRQAPLDYQAGMGTNEYDIEGRLIRTKYPTFTLFNVYFPNGKRDQSRLTYKLDFYASLLEICDQMHFSGEKIVICGDFNTAHREIDLKNPRQNETTSGFLPEERVWIDHYLEHGFVDPFRAKYPERVQYTWWTYRMGARERNIGWRIDFFLVTESLLPFVKEIVTYDQVYGSDHCPVELIIE
jgi:exodeoxyribonuclease-3